MTQLTRADELFVATRLLARARHTARKLENAHGKTLHPQLVQQMHADVAECTRVAVLMQAETPDEAEQLDDEAQRWFERWEKLRDENRRLRALLAEFVPDGIRDGCDDCGGDDAKCDEVCCVRRAQAELASEPAS